MLAALTRSNSTPSRSETPSGSSGVLKGLGAFSLGSSMNLAALAVPQGGAKKTACTDGCSSHWKTNIWSANDVRSKEITPASMPACLVLSTAIALEKPCLLKLAVTPAVPQKISMTMMSPAVRPLKSGPRSQLPFGTSSAWATLKAWGLKQLALKHTWRPL